MTGSGPSSEARAGWLLPPATELQHRLAARYRCKGARVWLHAENPAFPDVVITEESGFEVWGVIPRCIRML